jgi:cytochrome P450 family 6
MMFCLYELAQNPQVQEQLQQEIDKVLARHDGEVTYEGIQEMEYMDMVVSGQFQGQSRGKREGASG